MMTKMKRRTATGLLAAIAALAMLPAGAALAQEKVIRVLRSPVGTFQGLYIAEEQGYFKEAGIKVEVTIGGAPTQNIAQLQAGQTDVIMSGAFDIITAVAQGLPVTAVLNTQNQGDVPTTGLLVPPNGTVKAIADLKGKAVGLPGGVQSTQGLLLLRALESAGIAREDVKIVNLPFDAMIESAERGAVDAIIPIGLFYSLAQSKGFTSVDEAYQFIKGNPAVIFASSKSFVAENADAMKAFVAAMEKAYAYGNEHQDAVRAVDAAQTKMPPDYIKTRYIAPFVAAFPRDVWGKAVADMERFGFIPKAPAEADYIWEGAPK
ncbi:ABC transporter substrate-binding protein [Rhizobium alvei]|uniref:ABC transporter substrate-binding protein n=1 Tax=Rhizobium alvei TaxID=1132659 RepID=A0ABT8YRW5_9HYPH|nr:ABC transporter substrate-binding protein [Rhizobium alvei]MDO6966362.1 ABC transporter substrate-binding protein [Rhizobium alvei]